MNKQDLIALAERVEAEAVIATERWLAHHTIDRRQSAVEQFQLAACLRAIAETLDA